NEKSAVALFKRALASAGATIAEPEGDGPRIWRVSWPHLAQAEMYPPRAFAFQDDHAIVVGTAGDGDAEAALRRQLAGHGLANEPAFKAVRGALGEPWLAFVYCSPALVKQELTAQQSEGALGPLASGGAGAAFELSDEKLE